MNKVLEVGERVYLTQHRSGNGRGLSTGKLLPNDWLLLEVIVVEREDGKLILEIKPMTRGN